MTYTFPLLLLSLTLFSGAGQALADSGCTVVADLQSMEILHEKGDCKTRHAPQSTFKIPLAVMGFETGILKDAHTPTWDYKPEYKADMEKDHHATDPARWEKESVVWFSQKLTGLMGLSKFKKFVESFDYGNKDVSGDAGKNNGLTHSWLSSSLAISPLEQIGFLRKLLNHALPVFKDAQEKTIAIMPQFESGGWNVHGKTGTGYARKADGTLDKNIVYGWFVGWAEKNGRTLVFAKLASGKPVEGSYAGPRARDAFLKDLPAIMDKDRRNEH